ncbi:DUF3311 domain-containing protein [Alicyclobacillus sp. SO9]|uniref:DUF3311 domain-containing protein n=1 Tax=Alicyclobacillus sp. SO9 TaxID=2665646 RepID=UPI0018E88ED7|nr:DUF3311 domain-containing protein [Alicyclobacillus sp. SO9]QQE78891.1 DUF3311 domain-containing protein [Alicyclobacillus sp. SO9]
MRGFLMIIILVGNIIITPFVNHLHPVVFGMSFFLFWFLIWMFITPLLTWWIYAIDKRKEASEGR